MTDGQGSILGLDVGTVRIGVSITSLVARLPRPLTTLQNDGELLSSLKQLCAAEDISMIVVGLPRGLDGQETDQTRYCRQFAERLHQELDLPVTLQDEALTSTKAETELAASRKPHRKEDIDALAATYILEDYVNTTSPTGANQS